jgi:hypothetical protein
MPMWVYISVAEWISFHNGKPLWQVAPSGWVR